MKQRRPATPYLISTKYPAVCACKKPIKAGDEALYYPASKSIECRECATSTLNMLADERMMG